MALFNRNALIASLLLVLAAATLRGQAPAPNEAPAKPGEWGFRPEEGQLSPVNPPGFVWRPQSGAVSYELECSRDASFKEIAYRAQKIGYACHCPPRSFEVGQWYWRFRFVNKAGQASAWSKARAFSVSGESIVFPIPVREELLGRIPKQHPRLFVRPEQIAELRRLAGGELKAQFDALVAESERLLKNPPPTAEPPTYPAGVSTKSEEWRVIWWGNREYVIKTLNGAATLGFTRLLTGKDEYGQAAKRILLACAQWDPKGSTGYRYNDEAGMPYNYYFARTYSFINDLLSEEEKALCRQVMSVRGKEMYNHLSPRHLWQPYASHSNRAWHKLGEVGIAFLGEIPEAEEWVWFAMNVFYNAYPVWCDADGGWHEGSSYWQSYIHRFTWWADVMRVAMGVDAYKKPYFSKIGYYALYLQPPGTKAGGFGDLTPTRASSSNQALMTILAAQAANPYWQWYVEAHGQARQEPGYIGFIRGALPKVQAKAPDDLPSSRCFWGTGQAVLNTDLKSAADNVELVFKSSPFGTQSHGYDANNSFLLYAYGQPLLVSTGRRDIYGSDHHTNWMWETKSTNSITVNGKGQTKHSSAAQGQILAFHTSRAFDYVAGEAAPAYAGELTRFTRHVLFLKPDLLVLYDQLEAPKASTFEYLLHSPTEMKVAGAEDIQVANGAGACRVSLLVPGDLALALTDKYAPPPRPRIKVTEWHLTAQTRPAQRVEFVTLIRPHRSGATPASGAKVHRLESGYAVEADLADGQALLLLRSKAGGALQWGGQSTEADLAAVRLGRDGRPLAHLIVRGQKTQEGAGPLGQ